MADPVGLLHLHAAFAKWEFLFHGHGSRHWVFFVTNLDWTVVSWGFHLEIRSNPLVEQLHQWLKTAATQRHCPHTPILLKGISSLRWIWYPPIPNIYIYTHPNTHLPRIYHPKILVSMHYGLGFLDLLSDFFRREIHESRAKSKWLVGYWDWLVGWFFGKGRRSNQYGWLPRTIPHD